MGVREAGRNEGLIAALADLPALAVEDALNRLLAGGMTFGELVRRPDLVDLMSKNRGTICVDTLPAVALVSDDHGSVIPW